MTTQPFYNTGTAVLTNGSTAMVGTGTFWSGNIRAFDRVVGKDGKSAIVASVTDNTHIVLTRAWQGTTQATDVYEIWMSPDELFLQTVTRAIFATLQSSALTGIGGLTPAANTMPYFDGSSIAALATITTFARSILDDADASTALSTLGVSTFIKTLLDDADAATARATIGAQTALGFSPVQQGGGIGQLLNKLYLGWSSGFPKLTVDSTDLGRIWTDFEAARSIVANGYQKFPGGLIMQWGSTTNAATDFVLTYPIAFPNACVSVSALPVFNTAANTAYVLNTSNVFSYQCDIRCRTVTAGSVVAQANLPITWKAIGY